MKYFFFLSSILPSGAPALQERTPIEVYSDKEPNGILCVHFSGISRGRAVGAQLAQDAPKLYRPPKASEEYDARVRAQWKEESQRIATVVGGPKLPPGAEFIQPVSRSAKKNAARKAKKRREAAAKEALDQNI